MFNLVCVYMPGDINGKCRDDDNLSVGLMPNSVISGSVQSDTALAARVLYKYLGICMDHARREQMDKSDFVNDSSVSYAVLSMWCLV